MGPAPSLPHSDNRDGDSPLKNIAPLRSSLPSSSSNTQVSDMINGILFNETPEFNMSCQHLSKYEPRPMNVPAEEEVTTEPIDEKHSTSTRLGYAKPDTHLFTSADQAVPTPRMPLDRESSGIKDDKKRAIPVLLRDHDGRTVHNPTSAQEAASLPDLAKPQVAENLSQVRSFAFGFHFQKNKNKHTMTLRIRTYLTSDHLRPPHLSHTHTHKRRLRRLRRHLLLLPAHTNKTNSQVWWFGFDPKSHSPLFPATDVRCRHGPPKRSADGSRMSFCCHSLWTASNA